MARCHPALVLADCLSRTTFLPLSRVYTHTCSNLCTRIQKDFFFFKSEKVVRLVAINLHSHWTHELEPKTEKDAPPVPPSQDQGHPDTENGDELQGQHPRRPLCPPLHSGSRSVSGMKCGRWPQCVWALGSGVPCHPGPGLWLHSWRVCHEPGRGTSQPQPHYPVLFSVYAALGNIRRNGFIYLKSRRTFWENRHLVIQLRPPSAKEELRPA